MSFLYKHLAFIRWIEVVVEVLLKKGRRIYHDSKPLNDDNNSLKLRFFIHLFRWRKSSYEKTWMCY